jgi:hypothetical protein
MKCPALQRRDCPGRRMRGVWGSCLETLVLLSYILLVVTTHTTSAFTSQRHSNFMRDPKDNNSHEKGDRNCSVLSPSVFQDVNKLDNATEEQSVQFLENVLCHLYEPWTSWRPCNRKCQQVRVRRCRTSVRCGRRKLREKRSCRRKGQLCVPGEKIL